MIALSQPRHSKRAKNNWSTIFPTLSVLLIGTGFASLGYVAYVLANARIFEARESAKLSRAVAQPGPPLVPPVLAEGDVIGELQVQRLGWSAIVVQGDSDDVLRRAAGHVPGTALPGQMGNIAIAGHRDTIFRALRDIQVGDTISLKTADRDETYRVDSTEIVPPTDVGVLGSAGSNELTLITCFPFHYVGHAPKRFIVRAEQTSGPLR